MSLHARSCVKLCIKTGSLCSTGNRVPQKATSAKQTSELLAKIHTHVDNVRILNMVENLCVTAVCVKDLFLANLITNSARSFLMHQSTDARFTVY